MTKAQVMSLVSKLKLSEAEKIACGKRLLAFYQSVGQLQ